LISVRKALGHLPASWQDQVLRTIQAKAERDELGANLERIHARHGDSGLELEFWFKGGTELEASQCAAAAIRDAAAASAGR
jgi:hypothetical protein